jgi:hypothetical protein
VDDVLQVADAAGQAVDAGDHQGVAGAQEVEKAQEFGPAVAARARRLLGADHFAASSSQCTFLD